MLHSNDKPMLRQESPGPRYVNRTDINSYIPLAVTLTLLNIPKCRRQRKLYILSTENPVHKNAATQLVPRSPFARKPPIPHHSAATSHHIHFHGTSPTSASQPHIAARKNDHHTMSRSSHFAAVPAPLASVRISDDSVSMYTGVTKRRRSGEK
jgi:hypothetical protein